MIKKTFGSLESTLLYRTVEFMQTTTAAFTYKKKSANIVGYSYLYSYCSWSERAFIDLNSHEGLQGSSLI